MKNDDLNNYESKARSLMVAISGVMGSGKTTLATRLGKALNCEMIRENAIGMNYLEDLAQNPSRWAFETQLAFFAGKALEIRNSVAQRKNLIIDRTLEEDVVIFSKYFKEMGYIDARSYDLYATIADELSNKIPYPQIIIYCNISPEIAFERILMRRRGDYLTHSIEMIKKIHELYAAWILNNKKAMIYELNSNIVDWRTSDIFDDICEEIKEVIMRMKPKDEQLNLFENNYAETDNNHNLKYLKRIGGRVDLKITMCNNIYSGLDSHKKKIAYIAAPFTGKDTSHRKVNNDLMFEVAPLHGIIKRGKYRSTLLGIAQEFERYGYQSVLPHRDVNKWGNKSLTPTEVVEKCTLQVMECDLFCGLLGESCGSHYEFGLALGMGKPSILINCREINNSFIANGMEMLERNNITAQKVKIINVDRLYEIKNLMQSPDIIQFIVDS